MTNGGDAIAPSGLARARGILPGIYRATETPAERQRRIDNDLHDLRVLAWLVARNRYNREGPTREGGHRGKPEIITQVWYAEPQDLLEAERAVREIVRRRQET